MECDNLGSDKSTAVGMPVPVDGTATRSEALFMHEFRDPNAVQMRITIGEIEPAV